MTDNELIICINSFWKHTKSGELSRKERFKEIIDMTDKYIEIQKKRPNSTQLDSLATICLYEEITDSTPWKIRNNAYPIHSPRQRKTIRDNEAGEGPLLFVDNDGRQHGRKSNRT